MGISGSAKCLTNVESDAEYLLVRLERELVVLLWKEASCVMMRCMLNKQFDCILQIPLMALTLRIKDWQQMFIVLVLKVIPYLHCFL